MLTGGGEAAGDVIVDVGVEEIVEMVADRAGVGDGVAGDFADADEVAIGGGDENFVGGVEIFGAEHLFDDRDAGFGRDFHEDAAGDAFEAAGVERRGEDLAFSDGENIRRSAFGNFPALIEKEDIIAPPRSRIGKHSIIQGPPRRLMP